MPETGASASKVCVVCGVNVADKPRVKDAAGRYMCKSCAENQTAAKPTTGTKAPPAGGASGGGKAARGAVSKSADKGAMPLAPEAGFDPVMASLVASSKQVTSSACPNCKGWVKDGQLLCTSCGYNLEEGKQVRTRVQKEKAPKEKGAAQKAIDGGALAPIFWIVGACVGGAIGVGIAYASASSGVISKRTIVGTPVLIGVCCGVGTTIAARDTAGLMSGVVAMIAALLSLGIGRYLAVQEMLDDFGMGGMPFDEWYFQSMSPFEGIAALVALFVAWKIGSTGTISGEG